MSENQDNSVDLLGLKAYGEAVNTVAKGVVEGAGAFLSRVCLPASEEFGLFLQDKVSNWRKQNALKIIEKFKDKLDVLPDGQNRHAHPRMATLALERGSWADSEEVQNMWAGLLTSSCTKDGKDESNLIFINLLDQLTSLQAKILNHACQNAVKQLAPNGLFYADGFYMKVKEIQELTGVDDVLRFDRELDHLRSLNLLATDSGFDLQTVDGTSEGRTLPIARLEPTGLCLNFYVRCQGSLISPIDFFELSNVEKVGKPKNVRDEDYLVI